MTGKVTKDAFENVSPWQGRWRKIFISEVGNAANDLASHISLGLMTSWEELMAINPHLLTNP